MNFFKLFPKLLAAPVLPDLQPLEGAEHQAVKGRAQPKVDQVDTCATRLGDVHKSEATVLRLGTKTLTS